MNAFWLLCATLSLAVFFIGSVAGALLANAAAWLTWRFGNRARLLRSPGLLFSIRILPLMFAVALTVGFALPSFLLLEPTRSVETPEPYLIVLAGLGMASIVFLITRCARLLAMSSKALKKWLRRAELLPMSLSAPVYLVQSPDSLVAVAGILNPRVLVGRTALATLTKEELRAAIAHELAHVRSLDNLKQLVLKITRLPRFFPSLTAADTAWSAAVELAADADALRQGTSPLELSSAIVKVCRLKAVPIEALSVAACHLIPADGASALAIRVQHLQEAMEANSRPRAHAASYRWSLGLVTGMVAYLLVLPAALPVVHRWMEWLAK